MQDKKPKYTNKRHYYGVHVYQTFPMSVNVASSRSVANTVNVFFNSFTNLSSSWNFKFS